MAQKNRKINRNGSFTAVLYTIGLLLAAFALLFIPVELAPRGMMSFGMLDDFFTIRLLLALTNIVLIAYLLFVHVKDYLALRSSFTLGILAFLFCFLLYAISSFPPLHSAGMMRGPDDFGGPMRGSGLASLGVFSFVPMIFTAIALLVFAKISSE